MQLRQIVRAFRLNGTIVVPEIELIAVRTLSLRSTGPVIHGSSAPTYGVNVSINALLGNLFVITPTDGTGFQVDLPTNVPAAGQSQRITIKIFNTFGGLGALVFEAGAGGFRIGAATAQPAIGFSRSYDFDFDPVTSLWVEANRSAADVAN